ncbi:hypothetical protein BGZ79_006479 [Entomortierella chlamydospora]|nr:hypothetical protein BGZ79_006479 [Entomortierella chlamydospora]
MTSRFAPYLVPRPRRTSSLPFPPLIPPRVEYMDLDFPAEKVQYMDIDGFERPRFPRTGKAPRAQPAHPITTRQMKIVGPRSLTEGCPPRKGGSGTRMCRTRALGGGWAALSQRFSGGGYWPMAMDLDEDL